MPSLLADVETRGPSKESQSLHTVSWLLNLKATLSWLPLIRLLKLCFEGTSQVCGPGHFVINLSLYSSAWEYWKNCSNLEPINIRPFS